MSGEKRYPFDKAVQVAVDLARMLQPACEGLYIAGSLRRRKSTVGDIELVARPALLDGRNALHWLLDMLLDEGTITERGGWGQLQRKFWYREMPVDLYMADESRFGYQLWLRTGPGDANQWLVTQTKMHSPATLKGGRVWWHDEQLFVPTEEHFFDILGMPVILPNQRTIATYKRAFDVEKMVSVDLEPFVWHRKQKTMFSLNALHVEYYSEADRRDTRLAIARNRRIPFRAPWLREDGKVWARPIDGTGDRYIPVDPKSTTAYLFNLDIQNREKTDFLQSEEADLLRWLRKRQIEEANRQMRCYVSPDVLLPVMHVLDGEPDETARVPIEHVIPTQEGLNFKHVSHYFFDRGRCRICGGWRDDNELLPSVIALKGDYFWFLMNGHHRMRAAEAAGERFLKADIFYVEDTTFADLLADWYAGHTLKDDEDAEFLADVLEEALEILNSQESLYA